MRILTIQLEITDYENKEERIRKVDNILNKIDINSEKPDLIMLPELWGCGFFDYDAYEYAAEDLNGPTVQLLSSHAKRLSCNILTGSFIEKREGKLYNTAVLLGRDGKIAGQYSKIHLYGYNSKETQLLTRGNATSVIDTEFGKVGLATCYDLRFPEQFREMAERGAKIFLVVSAWPMVRVEHWRLFNRVRALENQCFMISCDCAGSQNGTVNAGHSMIVKPDGTVIAEADDKETLLTGEINPSEADEYRADFPAFADRKVLF